MYAFIKAQDTYLRRQAEASAASSSARAASFAAEGKGVGTGSSSDEGAEVDTEQYWEQVQLVLDQLDGLLNGVSSSSFFPPSSSSSGPLSLYDLWLINNDGDVLDIQRAQELGYALVGAGSNGGSRASAGLGAGSGLMGGSRRFAKVVSDMNKVELLEMVSLKGHCSALLKVTANEADRGQPVDVLASHTTWSDYSEMFRFYKHYVFAWQGQGTSQAAVAAERQSFSSYPGMLSSTDDFTLNGGSNLLVIETTLNILDETLYRHLAPEKGVMSLAGL